MSLGLLVAAAVLAARGPRRPAPSGAGRTPDGGVGSGPAGATPSLAQAVSGVTSLLQSGLSPTQAWAETLGPGAAPAGVPELEALLRTGAARGRRTTRHGRGAQRHDPVLLRRARTVVAATRLAATLGAPLGPVLARVAQTLTADEDGEADRRAALAGPRSTARLLGWLPLVGPVLGVAIGADPLGMVLRGGAGTVAAVAGVGLVLVGRAWVRRLVTLAETERAVAARGGPREPRGSRRRDGTG